MTILCGICRSAGAIPRGKWREIQAVEKLARSRRLMENRCSIYLCPHCVEIGPCLGSREGAHPELQSYGLLNVELETGGLILMLKWCDSVDYRTHWAWFSITQRGGGRGIVTGFLGGLDLVVFCYTDEKTKSFPASLFQVRAHSHTLPRCLGSQRLNSV